ncbi:hypothetical protein BH23CHL7_BH23CHL7_06830 [soil metagenome]
MTYLLVPHEASSDAATLWVGAVAERVEGLTIEVGGRQPAPLTARWTAFDVRGQPLVRAQRIRIGGLDANRRYPVRLLADGAERATATLATLPDGLPTLDARPFVCLLGSCFCMLTDRAGSAGAALFGMPASALPHVKFLCGDQVYLDAPAFRYLRFFDEDDLRAELLSKYVETWGQLGPANGFARLLREGATYFLSDDHEFWNNAPMKTPLVRNTDWRPIGDGGASWKRIASELYRLFQAPGLSATFKVGRLSFRVLDTRLARAHDRSLLVPVDEMAALEQWVLGLDGPGVLVVSQLMFTGEAGLRGNLFDWGLPDFSQYGDLVRALQRAPHDVLILTGDVHYGRVSTCRMTGGAMLIEIVASPFALVDPRARGTWAEPPGVFPAVPVAGATHAPTGFRAAHHLEDNHFATLEFWADGPRVGVSVRAWPIPEIGAPSAPTAVFEQLLN